MGWPEWLQEHTVRSLRKPRAQRMLRYNLASIIWMWTGFSVAFVALGVARMALANDVDDILFGAFLLSFWLLFCAYQVERTILTRHIIELEAALKPHPNDAPADERWRPA